MQLQVLWTTGVLPLAAHDEQLQAADGQQLTLEPEAEAFELQRSSVRALALLCLGSDEEGCLPSAALR